MRECLTNPEHGYYTRRFSSTASTATTSGDDVGMGTSEAGETITGDLKDQFGKQGDFITSPEISQVFGELVGVWFVTEWMAQGRPDKGVQIIELGPGRGTLMDDVLRTVSQLKGFGQALDCVWLVEAGESLRERQCRLLCGDHEPQPQMKRVEQLHGGARGTGWWEATSKYGVPVRWVEDASLLPRRDGSHTPFIVAHEFFDALPIHAFEVVAARPNEDPTQQLPPGPDGKPVVSSTRRTPSTSSRQPQWRELLVTPTRRQPGGTTTTTRHPPPARSPAPTADDRADETEEFTLTLAKASTPNSLIMPSRARYRHLQHHPGSRVEISPDSHRYMADIARRIGGGSGGPSAPSSSSSPSSSPPPTSTPHHTPRSGGAALIIDYGPSSSSPDRTIPTNTLRAIKAHRVLASPFVTPGAADLSADVDFGALADAALEASEGVEVHGPIGQGSWLGIMGGWERVESLVKLGGGGGGGEGEDGVGGEGERRRKRREEIETAWRRLVETGPGGMGQVYKVMAVVPECGGRRRPVGFGGEVVGGGGP